MASRKSKGEVIEVVARGGKRNGGTGLPALPADLLAELQKDATDDSANVRSFGESNIISIKGGVFSFKGENLGQHLDCVILASASLNEYYEGAYDPNRKGVTPSCYALSATGKDMAPHANAPDKQSSVCGGCKMAEMGSASQGKGRACKQKVRLALLHNDDVKTSETVMEAMIVQVGVPAMSVSKYGNFVKVLANDARYNKMPVYRFRTRITLTPHPTYQFTMEFSPQDAINEVDVLQAVMARVRGEAKELVLAPFPATATDETAKEPAKRALPSAKPGATKGGRSRFSR